MRLSARTLANRRNARASTGPRTAAGKARVGKNALRHGLAIPVALNPALADEIEHLARLIAGQGANRGLLERARSIAEAQVDLLRVRRARYALLADPEARRQKISSRQALRACGRLLHGRAIDAVDRAVLQAMEDGKGRDAPPSLAEGFEALASQLMRLDRYERRALSRRKAAIRDFEEVSADQKGRRRGLRAHRRPPTRRTNRRVRSFLDGWTRGGAGSDGVRRDGKRW